MNATHPSVPEDAKERRLAEIEARLAKLETLIAGRTATSAAAPPPVAGAAPAAARVEDDLEFEVGQNWFAMVGIVVLTLGAGFTVSLPYAGLPAGVPSLIGYALAAGLFVLARIWRHAFDLVSRYLRGVAMALLYFATLRLYFFSPRPLLATGTLPGRAVLVLVVAANLAFAWHRRSPWLTGLALVMGYATAIAIGSAGFVLPALVVLAGLVAAGSVRGHWPGLVLAGLPLGFATYFIWAVNDPFLGRPFQLVAATPAGPGFLLAGALVLALAPLLRRQAGGDDGIANSCALLNCSLGYGVFTVHTLAGTAAFFTAAHLSASLVFLALAVLFWLRWRSRVSTFLYAMTGYLALSLAILRASAVPEVFVWLSVQSVVVVATAIWFRSRFIVVANFLIYAVIVLGYVLLAGRETGISIGFGLVALVSARILNWQKDRLELKTELMRNAYLLSAFVVFPYALHHLVPGGYVALSWIGLAAFYYLMNFIVRNRKFRWMGHATLLLTALYVLVVGTSRLEPVYRVLSFLVLGTVMLGVSLAFTRVRRGQRKAGTGAPATGP
jgi:hypothetical protein